MIKVDLARRRRAVGDLRRASLDEAHSRSRERFQALYLIASGQLNGTTCAAHIGRQDETVLRWAHLYNRHGPGALTYRHSGGRPHLTSNRPNRSLLPSRAAGRPTTACPATAWAPKKLKEWACRAFGLLAGRNSIRRVLCQAALTWKKVKKLLGKAKPQKRAAHIQQLLALFAGVCAGEVILIYVTVSFLRELVRWRAARRAGWC
jgi:transposase